MLSISVPAVDIVGSIYFFFARSLNIHKESAPDMLLIYIYNLHMYV